jgi:SAM-dependent methyltransferase
MSERTRGLYRLVTFPHAYRMIQRILSGEGSRKRVSDLLFAALDGKTVCEIGCGPGSWASEMDSAMNYIGIDWNKEHIDHANERYGNEKTRFFQGDVKSLESIQVIGPRDRVVGMGILHHLNDDAAVRTLEQVTRILKPGGRYIGLENVYHDNQNPIARILNALDSGKNVRGEDGYRQLFGKEFIEVHTFIRTDLMRVPYSHLLIEAIRR